MVASATRKAKKPRGSMVAMVHIPLTEQQKDRLDQMAVTDRRPLTEFMRILLDDEWDRRQKLAAQNGAAA